MKKKIVVNGILELEGDLVFFTDVDLVPFEECVEYFDEDCWSDDDEPEDRYHNYDEVRQNLILENLKKQKVKPVYHDLEAYVIEIVEVTEDGEYWFCGS